MNPLKLTSSRVFTAETPSPQSSEYFYEKFFLRARRLRQQLFSFLRGTY